MSGKLEDDETNADSDRQNPNRSPTTTAVLNFFSITPERSAAVVTSGQHPSQRVVVLLVGQGDEEEPHRTMQVPARSAML
jgi:hypothetical protein